MLNVSALPLYTHKTYKKCIQNFASVLYILPYSQRNNIRIQKQKRENLPVPDPAHAVFTSAGDQALRDVDVDVESPEGIRETSKEGETLLPFRLQGE